MAITFVSEVSGDLASGGGPTTANLPSGLQEGDVLISIIGSDSNTSSVGIQGQGWTNIENPGTGTGRQIRYKTMGATPDTTVDITHVSDRKLVYIIQAFRGVDSTVEDTPHQSASGLSETANPPSITTATDGALVIAIAVLDDDETTVSTFPSGYSNTIDANTNGAGINEGTTIAICSKIITSAGVEDPGNIVFGTSDFWHAFSIALRLEGAGGTDHTAQLSETMTISDSLSKKSTFNRALSETLNLADSLTTSGDITLALSDTLNLTDNLSSSANYKRLLADTQTISDSLSSKTEFKRLLSDLQNITDSLSRKVEYNRTLDDTITMSDSLSFNLAELVAILSKIFKLGLTSFDGKLVKQDKLIELGRISDTKLVKEDKVIKLKSKNFVFFTLLPVSHWKMNDNASSSLVTDSIDVNNGVSANNTSTMTVLGKVNNALYFNGTDDLVIVPHNSSLTMTDSMTISFWIKKDGNSTARDYIISKRRGVSSPDNYNVEIYDNKLQFWIYNSDWVGWQSQNIITDGTWEHWAIVFKNKSTKFYRNGEYETTSLIYGSANEDMVGNTEDLSIGGTNNATNFLKGSLDDIRIYNESLGGRDIEFIYNNGLGTEENNNPNSPIKLN